MTIDKIIAGEVKIEPWKECVYHKIKQNWDHVAKPLDSMGVFETLLAQIGAIQEETVPVLFPARILVMCADNGVVAEGISQSDQSVTRICTQNIALGKSSVGIMAAREQIDILAVDIGVNTDEKWEKVRNCKIRKGTRNFRVEPAMTREETLSAMQTGMELVWEARQEEYRILGVGEMGIGNTTTSSAVAAALLHADAVSMTGRGAGLNDTQLARKQRIIEEAIARYDLYHKDALEILSAVGGLDLAGLVGICLGGAYYQVPIVLDGFISLVAALVAQHLLSGVRDYLIPSHCSKEPAVVRLQEQLGFHPVIDASMALGEGTGAVLMLSLLRTVHEIYVNSCSFDEAGIEQYERYDNKR